MTDTAPAPASLVAGHEHATSAGMGMDDEAHAHSSTEGMGMGEGHAHCEPIPFQVPTINSITPNTDVAAGGAAVVIDGADFTPGMTATIGGTAIVEAPGYESPTRFAGTAPAGTVGVHDVSVTTTGGTKTLTGGFTYT
jgi:IPT/TIG domain